METAMQATLLKDTNSPLSHEQAEQLNQVIQGLRSDQLTWISGYLAGLTAGGHVANQQLAGAVPAAPASVAMPEITILFASETGNGQGIAEQACERAKSRGFKASVADMLDFKKAQFKKTTHLMAVAATHGEGDPPVAAEEMHELVTGKKAPKLEGTKFSVLALGDASYEHFCKAGKDFDSAFEAMGGQRIHPRVDCDVDYEDAAEQWIEGVLDAFSKELAAVQPGRSATVTPLHAVAEPSYSKKHPFPAPLVENLILSGRGSAKEVHHIELSLEGSGLVHSPGDALGIIPSNAAAAVTDLLAATGLNESDSVTGSRGEMSLRAALTQDYEITVLTRPLVEKYAQMAQASELNELLREGNNKALNDYLYGRELMDLVAQYPIKGISATDFTGLLRKLPPRLYSIASSYTANPDEVSLTVDAVRYHSHGRDHQGVGSTFLADRVAEDEQVLVYVDANKNFKLPQDSNTPVIMIGPGTGVAPFRAFMQEREELGAGGKNWLFFGAQHFLTDFLYQREWLGWRKSGLLTQLDVAFSRDQQDKIYVQHRLREQGAQLYAWLQEGAQLYVCGDADQMAHDVHEALIQVVAKHGGQSVDNATAYIKQLQKDKRYQRDVY